MEINCKYCGGDRQVKAGFFNRSPGGCFGHRRKRMDELKIDIFNAVIDAKELDDTLAELFDRCDQDSEEADAIDEARTNLVAAIEKLEAM